MTRQEERAQAAPGVRNALRIGIFLIPASAHRFGSVHARVTSRVLGRRRDYESFAALAATR
jgi:hypothetical protein